MLRVSFQMSFETGLVGTGSCLWWPVRAWCRKSFLQQHSPPQPEDASSETGVCWTLQWFQRLIFLLFLGGTDRWQSLKLSVQQWRWGSKKDQEASGDKNRMRWVISLAPTDCCKLGIYPWERRSKLILVKGYWFVFSDSFWRLRKCLT